MSMLETESLPTPGLFPSSLPSFLSSSSSFTLFKMIYISVVYLITGMFPSKVQVVRIPLTGHKQ